MSGTWFDNVPQDAHWLIVGGTRRGKTGQLQLMARAFIRRGLDGVTAIDPHGAFVRDTVEWLANPRNSQPGRTVIVLDPSSSTTFGLNCLEVPDTSWESCHLAATTLSSVVESRFGASPEQTPRLSRLIYVAAMFCARRRLTLLELLELLSLGGDSLRQSLLADFENTVVRNELEDLHTLAERQPARFLELVESTRNRFVRWLGDPRLARILGQRTGLNPRAIMDGRHIVLADFSSLNYNDAAFLGCVLSSMYFAAARYRPPMRCARHRLILDEAESLLTIDVARMCDQSAKMGLNLVACVQRLGQLRARGDFLCDALMTNCTIKTVFGGLPPESSRYMAETLHSGFIHLAEWKQGTERPVAVGSHKELANSRSTAEHEAIHEAESETESVASGTSRTRSMSICTADGESVTDATSHASAIGTMTSDAFGTASSSFEGLSSGASLDPNTGGLLSPPAMTGMSVSQSAGSGQTDIASRAFGSSRSRMSGSSQARSTSHMTAITDGVAMAESEIHGLARSRMRGQSRGTSRSKGESECFVTTYEWLPSATYSLEEQLHRLAGELANLPRRECYVKIEDQRPFRTRTIELEPAFRSARFKRAMLPIYLDSITRKSPFLLPISEAERAIAARFAEFAAECTDVAEPADWSERYTDPAAAKDVIDRSFAPPKPSRPTLVIDNDKPTDEDPDGPKA